MDGAAALDAGHRKIIVGVGGSATNDGGAGAAQALGVRLTDADGSDVALGAQGLLTLAHADVSQRRAEIADTEIETRSGTLNPVMRDHHVRVDQAATERFLAKPK